jgi:hypothetical protein
VEEGRVLGEGASFEVVDVKNGGEEEVGDAERGDGLRSEDGRRADGGMGWRERDEPRSANARTATTKSERLTAQLRSSPQVDQVLMIIESPDSFASRRLELKDPLQLPHDGKVGAKDSSDHGLLVLLGEGAGETEDEEVGEEGELVAGAVVQASRRAERGDKVVRELGEDWVLSRGEERELEVLFDLVEQAKVSLRRDDGVSAQRAHLLEHGNPLPERLVAESLRARL